MEAKNIKSEIKYYIKKIISRDNDKWSICIFKSDKKKLIFSKIKNKKILKNINVFKPPKDEFWADPFYFNYKNKKYIFFEKFFKKKNKGIISVFLTKDNKILKTYDILEKKYHLSYPFIFKHNNRIYLIPESYQAKKMQIYICKKFPSKWKLLKNHFTDEIIGDPTFFKYNNSLWFFINKTDKKLNNLNKKLFLYKMSNDLTKIIPHKKNPVKNSFYGGRSAGGIIKIKGSIIRPGQIQRNNNYGYGIVFFKIIKLSLNTFQERKISSMTPEIFENAKGVHHISNFGNNFVVDLNLKN